MHGHIPTWETQEDVELDPSVMMRAPSHPSSTHFTLITSSRQISQSINFRRTSIYTWKTDIVKFGVQCLNRLQCTYALNMK